MLFSSTYLCEQVFGDVNMNKLCYRFQLTDKHLRFFLKIASTTLKPKFCCILVSGAQLTCHKNCIFCSASLSVKFKKFFGLLPKTFAHLCSNPKHSADLEFCALYCNYYIFLFFLCCSFLCHLIKIIHFSLLQKGSKV